MLFTFFNKDIPIFDIDINFKNYTNFKIKKYYNPEYAPFGLYLPKINKFGINFSEWWNNRLIPITRYNFYNLFTTFNEVNELALQNLGVSLSDQYWLRPELQKYLSWKDVNPFLNKFLYDLDLDSLSCSDNKIISPNISLNGNLPKKWIIKDNKRLLCNYATLPALQEPINELIASKILDQLNLNHVNYFCKYGLSFCLCFINENTEFVPAWYIYNSDKKNNSENYYNFCLRLFDKLKVNYRTKLNQMILFDYLIANQDRHFNNFGFIRDVNTLEFIDFAPIFDNGCSLWYNMFDNEIGHKSASKPFNANQDKQLTLINDKSILDTSNLDIGLIVNEVFNETNYDKNRLNLIKNGIEIRINRLLSMKK